MQGLVLHPPPGGDLMLHTTVSCSGNRALLITSLSGSQGDHCFRRRMRDHCDLSLACLACLAFSLRGRMLIDADHED